MFCSPTQGDTRILSAALVTARSNFDSQRSLPAGSEEARKVVEHAEEVARVLRANVVQGEWIPGEKYRELS